MSEFNYLQRPPDNRKEFDMSKWFEKELANIPLRDRIRITLEMNDIKNWDNGEYKGDQTELTNHIMEDVKQWLKDGATLEETTEQKQPSLTNPSKE